MSKPPRVTVHGRFQPPLHVNHWGYVREGFERADHVTVLITNPYQNETFEETATWRNQPESNPFTFEERVFMFARFFKAIGIDPQTYDFKPFNIKDEAAFSELDHHIPNLVNNYSAWSAKKAELFVSYGLNVVQLQLPEPNPISGSMIREIISTTKDRSSLLPERLSLAGFMSEAIPGLIEIIAAREN